MLFGDGAGAVVLTAEAGSGGIADRGILVDPHPFRWALCDKLYVDGGPSTTGTVGHLRMEGREVFKHAVVNIASVMEETIDGGRTEAGGHRLVRSASGEPPHSRGYGPQTRHLAKTASS